MTSTTTTRGTLVKELCRKFPALPSLQLARMAYKEHRAAFKSTEHARELVRYYRGNHGKANRRRIADKTTFRTNRNAGETYTLPPSHAPSYDPFPLVDGVGLVLSDIHIPFHDRPSIEACVGFAKERTPDFVILNGDVCDFFSISRFDKNPTESTLKGELDMTRQFLGWIRQTFPKARVIYKLGNHDEWFDRYLWNKAPELFGVTGVSLKHLTTGPIQGTSAVEGIEWVDDQRKITYGKLSIYHGHEIGKGSIAPPVNPARGLFMRTLECGLMGHLHKDSHHAETSADGRLISCWSSGCLCGLHPRYARVNKWTHSAVWLELHAGQFSVHPIRLLHGQIL